MTDLDLNLIRVFVAIYETKSATAAAERLNLTQPTISYGLGKLRDVLSDQLFIRDQRIFKPTPRAVSLYQKFRDALESIGSAIDDTQSFNPKVATRIFSIAMTDIGSMYFLPDLEAHVCRDQPRIGIELRQVSVLDLVDELAAGKLDVAVGNLPSLRGLTRSVTLFREHYVCLLGKDYAASIQKMTMQAFLASRHVAVSSQYSGHQLAEDALTDLGISRQIVIRTPYYTALPQLIARSDLVVLLPSRIAAIFSTQSAVVAVPAPMDLPDFEVKMHWHSRHEASPALKWLLERVSTIGMHL
jgi:DNA-binding transcriptional LysR family regulator